MSVEDVERVEVTYGDLADGDVVVDRSGRQWEVSGLGRNGVSVELWLGHRGGKPVKSFSKPGTDPVTVVRSVNSWEPPPGTEPDPLITTEAAMVAVETVLGAKVVADVTTEQLAEAEAATKDQPVQVALFADMTVLERRTHLYLLHGIYAQDLDSMRDLERIHDDAHAGRVKSRETPHTHVAPPTEVV